MMGRFLRLMPRLRGEFERVMEWADKYRKLKVRTNADTPKDAKKRKRTWSRSVSDFAVLSICSLKRTELQHSER